MTGLDEASLAQNRASDPAASTWLSANAGSGKTRVLTDRVARLLLRGSMPQDILCLTYTKAAASEMQNRLFQRLGAWAMLDDGRLRNELAKLGVAGADLGRARTLFARAVETPGGLKIQTIHSFCAAILRRFPLEAGVSPNFTEIDDATRIELMTEVADALAEGPQAQALIDLLPHVRGDLPKLLSAIAGARRGFAPAVSLQDLATRFGVPPGLTMAQICAEALSPAGLAVLRTSLPYLRAGSSNDQKKHAVLETISSVPITPDQLAALEGVLLFKSGAKVGQPSPPTKDCVTAMGPLAQDFDDMAHQIAAMRPVRQGMAAALKTHALHAFAQVFLPAYAGRKAQAGLLDFDDLIERTEGLLTDPAVSAWVQYRLDGRIEHILIDEAQDTSPLQWQIVEHLTSEFGAGEGAVSNQHRTLFVVGDPKQSIYSFQGADAASFARKQGDFRDRLHPVGGLRELDLVFSFRSSPAILQLVDATFRDAEAAGFGATTHHRAHDPHQPGRVDLWPLVPKSDRTEKKPWNAPQDTVAASHHSAQLARMIAQEVERMIAQDWLVDRHGIRRPVAPGDIMILFQSRSSNQKLFYQVIQSCKALGLPMAGSDRVRLQDELAVRDICALLSALTLPEDDLSLATALRSPLFSLTEAQLYDLAQGRRQRYLWAELRDRRAEFPETWAMLADLMRHAEFLRPYEMIERILLRHHGRRNLIARLGAEVEDSIDELLTQALLFETRQVPSLSGFLVWFQTDVTEIKRQLDQASRAIRVMTVHGAKGLESPVVILPDTLRGERALSNEIFLDEGGTPLWSMGSDDRPTALDAAQTAHGEAEARERRRLLYVAMTRAESWLILCGAGEPGKQDGWYGDVVAGITALGPSAVETPMGRILRFETGDWTQGAAATQPPVAVPKDAPPWLDHPVPTPPRPPQTLAPSDLGGAKAITGSHGGSETEAALRRGRLIHLLLEHLPSVTSADWPMLARHLLSDEAAPEEVAVLLDQAGHVLRAPHLAHVFAPDALAEVAFTARLPHLPERPLRGVIDRLIITPQHVLAVDFKTNAGVPEAPADVPEGYLRQMGAYATALMQIYPDRSVQTAILWTETAHLMVLPNDIVMSALQRATTS